MKNIYKMYEATVAIQVRCGSGVGHALISMEDFDMISAYEGTWGGVYNKKTNSYYAGIQVKGNTIMMHRLLCGLQTGDKMLVDHINRNTLDNTRSNLRVVGYSDSNVNRGRGRNNTSGMPGVHYVKSRGRWVARVKRNGKYVYEKSFKDKEEAIWAVVAARNAIYSHLMHRKPIMLEA